MRNISFMLTTPQFLDGSKDVTRRVGWLFAKAGDVYCAVEKSQGLGKGGKVKKLGTIRVISVRRETLMAMIVDKDYGAEECRREGFPDMKPHEFVAFLCEANRGLAGDSLITRIEFEKVKEQA